MSDQNEQLKRQLATLQAQLAGKDTVILQMGKQAAVLAKESMAVKAQLRQVEGERDGLEQNCLNNHVTTEQADEKVKTLRQLVGALPVVNPKSLQIFEAADGNGFDVHGAIKEPYSVGWIGTFLHKAEAESYIQALTARATLAAQDPPHPTEERS